MDLELSLMGSPSRHDEVQALLNGFESRGRNKIKISYRSWDSAWSDMVRNSIHGVSPSVSEVGTSWVPDLVGMNALYPLPATVTAKCGNKEDYVSQSWKSCFLVDNPQMWAIPWVSGARVIYYRRDLLEKAGINPDNAFLNPTAMAQTLSRLQAAGVERPWITSTIASLNTLHLISSWIWAAGGDYISKDGMKLLFAEKEAVDGMANFFALAPFLGPNPHECSYPAAIDLFWKGEAAVTMDGTWIYGDQKATAAPVVLDNLGVALAPGPAYVGGSNLVIWTNTADKFASEDLLLFMLEPASVLAMAKVTGLAPARLDSLRSPEIFEPAYGDTFVRAIETGRSMPSQMFSGMIEDKLHYTFGNIWADVLDSPDADLHEIITNRLIPLKRRLEIAIFG
ncbi:MAG TPA: extracellular solute-binding protein [Anaerolineales bacterium]|nr:extracellular solute-binding protein [Anaerolineales bacterium]